MADESVGVVLDQLTKLKVNSSNELSFADKGLKLNTESDALEVATAIRECPHMTALRLEGNTIGVDAAKAIGKALEAHPELERALWKDMFTGRLKTEIPKALMFFSGGLILAGARLVELDLSDNALGPIGIQGIKELLCSPTCYTLQELRLNNNGLGIGGGQELSKALIECHTKSSADGCPLKLRVLICGRNRLENSGAEAIAKFIKVIGTLEEIQMPQDSIFHEGITALCDAMQYNQNLHHINLNDNIFTALGAKSMAELLPKLKHLEVLNFGDCLLKSAGAKLISESLKSGHSKLKELNFGFNEIRQEVLDDILECVKHKPALEKLELNGNQIGDGGGDYLKNKLEEMGKSDILGSLSDDEGDDDDDEEAGSEDDSEEDGDEESHVTDSSLPRPPEPKSTPESERNGAIPVIQCTPKEFLATPSASYLMGLGEHKAEDLLQELAKDERGLEKYIEAFIKVSSIIQSGNENVKKAVCDCTDAVFREGFTKADQEDSSSIFANTFLAYLGLIKSEDKNIHPPKDLTGPLTILEHSVRQSYFPRNTKEMLQFFLSRFHDAVERTGEVKHRLLMTLYQY